MKRFTRILSMLLIMTMLFSTYTMADEVKEERYGQRMEDVMELIMQSYLNNDEVTKDELFDAAMKGMFDELDVYSDYIPPAGATEFNNSLSNTYVGIGVRLTQVDEYVVVDEVFYDGPADIAGLIAHDKIIGVNEQSIIGSTPAEAASVIIGEEGTKVTLTIDRGGYVFDVELTRAKIVMKTVVIRNVTDIFPEISKASAAKIGYIDISSFTEQVDEELAEVLARFKIEGKKYLLLDMRDNSGGLVNSGVSVLNQLVPAGPVLKFVDNSGREIVYRSYLKEAEFEIVAMVNGNSASATEFVAAAIKEADNGTVVGENTYGKGVAQYLYTLDNGGVIKLTQDAFYSGNDVPIHEVGVTPDVEVTLPNLLKKEEKYHPGDWYNSVADLEKLLSYLGYEVGPIDTVYDQKTVEAVIQFQKDNELYAYGVCDFATQDAMNMALIKEVRVNDAQLKKGLSILLGKINKN